MRLIHSIIFTTLPINQSRGKFVRLFFVVFILFYLLVCVCIIFTTLPINRSRFNFVPIFLFVFYAFYLCFVCVGIVKYHIHNCRYQPITVQFCSISLVFKWSSLCIYLHLYLCSCLYLQHVLMVLLVHIL